MKEKNSSVVGADIDKFTKQGTQDLQQGNLKKALESFEVAFKQSQKLGDGFAVRACAFNVGAVCVALHEPQKGLQFLQRAIPPAHQRDGKSNGDLYYNFGLAYEALDNSGEAVKYYELALEEYHEEKDNRSMEADVATKVGDLYSELGNWLPAARSYGVAANTYAKLDNHASETIALCHQATSLLKGGRHSNASQAADNCMVLCQSVTEDQTLGKVICRTLYCLPLGRIWDFIHNKN